MSNGVDDLPLPPLPGGLQGLLNGTQPSLYEDASTILSRALVDGTISLDSEAARALLFLDTFCGDWGKQVAAQIWLYRRHLSPGAAKQHREAISAFALRDFISRMNINLGGG